MQLQKLGLSLLVSAGVLLASILPAEARRVSVTNAWQRVYAELPQLPKENQYIFQESQRSAMQNTFAKRLISYHIYVKGRPPALRLDWKHTIADYLGANEAIEEDTYPSRKRLRASPLAGDRRVVQAMTRQQRNQLIDVLIKVLSPRVRVAKPAPAIIRPRLPKPEPLLPTPPKTAPLPGGADLLK